MYRILYNDSTIFDPYGNENEVVTDASMSVEINAAAYMDFTMSRLHPLYKTIAERDGVVTLYWDGNVLFQGVIESIDIDIQGNKAISCVSALDYLNDTVVRPYSTIAGEQELTAPSSVDGYFQWLIDQHNERVLDSRKRFDVGVNQGANLQQNNFIYRSSTNNPTTASEISDQLLNALGGYLTMRYVDDRYVLDLYADLHTMNTQIVDFGVNITDFSKTIDTKDQYNALILKGGSPEFQGGDFESGDWSHWVTHPNEPLVGDKTHGGDVSSYFVSGAGEYVNDSFFYFRSGRRYKATVYVKNERGSNVTIHGGYQYEQSGTWTTVNVGTSLTVENKDDQWVEFSFDFQPNLSEHTKIRPRWYFDNVANDSNRRVYLDDFSFSQVSGDTDVAEDPISVSMVPDGGTQYDSNILKTGDVIYDPSSVSRYGYKEEMYEDSTITDVDDLLQAGIKELNKLKDPQIGLDIKAVDLALFMEGHTHLNVGDAVRVRSAIHDTDEFLMVNSITLDLQDPGQSEYNIGKAYDSLTGQQSGFLRSLNSGINSSLDAVASLDQTTKDQAIQIGNIEQVANDASEKANNAQNTANSNKEAIESAKSDIDSLRSSTETEFQNVKQSVSDVQSDVESVTQKAADLESELDGTKATVEQVTTDLGEVKTTVSNAATKADQSLQVSTQASQTATQAQTTATSAYQDAQSALTQSSTASQTANAVKTELETNYSTTDEIAEQYATKSLVEQTSQSITSTVEATYATKATVEALENIANNAVQTWMGSGVPTLSNKPASDWTTADLKSQHSGDIYYDSDTGYSYRFGSSDGSHYSWSLIKDTDISKAVADAAKAQQTAEGVSDEVTQLKTDIPATYATKTEVKQTTDSIKSSVSEVATTANSALSKATTVEQTANAVKTELETNYSTTDEIAEQYATKSLVEQTSQSITSTVEATYATKATVEALENIANNAVQTWMGSGVPTLSNKPASDWTTADLKSQHSGDIYYDSDTGYSYRFGSSDGSHYSWSLIKDTDISKAVADAAKAQQTAEGVSDEVTQLKTDIPATYATKTEVKQTTDSIKSSVSEVATTANSALSKATTVEQTANGLQTTVTEQAEKLDDAVTTISQVNQRVDSLSSTITQVSNTEQNGLIRNGGFETGDMTGWTTAYTGTQTFVEKRNNAGEIGDYLCRFYRPSNNNDGTWTGIASEYFPIIAGHTYQITISAFYSDAPRETAVGLRLKIGGYLQRAITTNLGGDGTWHQLSGTVKMTSGNSARVEIDANGTTVETSRILVDGVSVIDVTEGKTANDTANSALSKSSSVEQNLNSFKTSVSQNYETKSDALSKQSSLQQSVNNLRTEVSETYTTKTEFNNLQVGGTNIARDTQAFGHNGVSSTEEGYLKGYVNRTNGTYKGLTVRNIISSDGTGVVVCEYLVTNVKHSEYYTLSFWAKGSGRIRAYFYGPSGYIAAKAVSASNGDGNAIFSNGAWNMTVSSSWQRYFVVYQTAPSGGTSTDKYMLLRNDNDMASCDVCGVMIERGNKASDWSASPLDVSATYSTKSYVDQTSRTVSLGVVEEYKNGQHGSALATQSDITAATDSITSTVSQTYATKTEVKQTSDSLTVSISSATSKAESAATAASKAQSTANTANTNAINANNRVGNLETCIKMTSDGVRVGKISNGNFTGYSALINSAASFDILDASSKTLASFNKDGLIIKSTSDRDMFVGFNSVTKSGYIGSMLKAAISEGVKGVDIGMHMSFVSGGYLNIINNLGGIGIAGRGIQLIASGSDRVKIGVMDVRGAGVVLFDKDDSHNYSAVEIARGYNFSEFNYIMCFFKTNDGQYFGGTAYHPNGKEYCFTTMGGGSGTTDMSYLKGTRWKFNGTKATRKTTFEIGPRYSTAVNDAVLHIVAIVGFDYYKTSG